MTTECNVQLLLDQLVQPASVPYRYFNQPIEQIPGWIKNNSQILSHRKDSGLQWLGLNQCLQVGTCITLGSSELILERKNIPILVDDISGEDCIVLGTEECETPSPGETP